MSAENQPESFWLTRAKQLLALSESGLSFSNEPFELERYEAIAVIAREMLAELGNLPIETFHQSDSILPDRYNTPLIDVRGAVFKDNKILLVQEAMDGLWTLPGGYTDVGLSAAENVEKEIREESGVLAKVSCLYALRHKAKGPYNPDVREFYKIYFLCEMLDDTQLGPSLETLDAAFFELSALPPLSTQRVVERDIHQAWEHFNDPQLPCRFD